MTRESLQSLGDAELAAALVENIQSRTATEHVASVDSLFGVCRET
jgi:hypothetical protein